MSEITLLLGSNDFTQLTGPIFQSYLPKATNIYELDLSDNDFGDDGTSLVLSGLQQNSSIKRFVFEKNFKVRSKLRRKATMVIFYSASSSLGVNRSNQVFLYFVRRILLQLSIRRNVTSSISPSPTVASREIFLISSIPLARMRRC